MIVTDGRWTMDHDILAGYCRSQIWKRSLELVKKSDITIESVGQMLADVQLDYFTAFNEKKLTHSNGAVVHELWAPNIAALTFPRPRLSSETSDQTLASTSARLSNEVIISAMPLQHTVTGVVVNTNLRTAHTPVAKKKKAGCFQGLLNCFTRKKNKVSPMI